MNVTTNVTSSLSTSSGVPILQQLLSKFSFHLPETTSTTRQPNRRLTSQQQHKPFTIFEKLEIGFLCFILVEHTILFILTFHKKSKKTFVNTNSQQTHSRPIILPSKSLLYNCLHRNWIRAYSFSNICLSSVYFINLFLKHYHPSLVHYSSITFYSLPLTLVQQILSNFHTFHLLIISISILQYFIRYYRLLKNKYSLNIYNGRNLLITKHTNVALILSGSLALIFAYNYIFYAPKNTQTVILLPLITLNMLLLPLIDFTIFILVFLCCFLNLSSSTRLSQSHFSSENPTQHQQQRLTESFRSSVEKMTCVKCYSKFLQQNRSILQDTDPYTKLHTRFFTHNLLSSTRPSISPSEDLRKFSTASFENLPMIPNVHARLRASYPGQTTRSFLLNRNLSSQPEFPSEQRMDHGRNSTNELFLQTALIQLKRKHSFCHLCYRLLLIFLLKYVLLTFPQHYMQMNFHLKQFFEHILKLPMSNNHDQTSAHERSATIIRLIFLFARFGDCLLLTSLPNFIRNYFPCWCHFNSQLFREKTQFEQASDQILVRNTDSSTNDPLSNEDLAVVNEDNQPRMLRKQNSSRSQYRLRFQFVPIWSKKRSKFIRENS